MDSIRQEIAITAARLVAEDGLDYGAAKRKALQIVFGREGPPGGGMLPDNAEIEAEVRVYQALFQSDVQPARLAHLRQVAVAAMRRLAQFDPYLVGPVLNGTAGEHSDVSLQVFVDSPKDVEIFLLNEGIEFEVGERNHFRGKGTVEALAFQFRGEVVHLALYQTDDVRGARKRTGDGPPERADLRQALALLDEAKAA